MSHVFVDGMYRLAGAVEKELFRIEKENRWLRCLVSGLMAGVAVAVVSWIFSEQDLLLFACCGSSAAAVVFSPISRNNSLRSILLAYGVSALVSVVLYPIHVRHWLPMYMQCFWAVFTSIAMMRVMDAMHPAAVGAALAFIIYERDTSSLGWLLLAIMGLLTVVKILAYIYLEELQFRYFGREFRRDYYGKEVRVIVVAESVERGDAATIDVSESNAP